MLPKRAASSIWAREKLETPIARILPWVFKSFIARMVSSTGTLRLPKEPEGQWI